MHLSAYLSCYVLNNLYKHLQIYLQISSQIHHSDEILTHQEQQHPSDGRPDLRSPRKEMRKKK